MSAMNKFRAEMIIGYPDHTWEDNHFVEFECEVGSWSDEISAEAVVVMTKKLRDSKTSYSFVTVAHVDQLDS